MASHSGINQFIKDVKDAGFISHLSEQYHIEHYAKKYFLYQEGKKPRNLFFLSKGKVKGFKTHEDGKEYITDLFGPGDFYRVSGHDRR